MMRRRFHGIVLGMASGKTLAKFTVLSALTMLVFYLASPILAQSLGNAGTIQGTVVDCAYKILRLRERMTRRIRYEERYGRLPRSSGLP